MRHLILAATAAGLTLAAGAASAQTQTKPSGLYLRLDTGVSMSSDLGSGYGNNVDAGNSYLIGGGVGYRYSPNFRVDATLGYRGDYHIGFTRALGAGVTGSASGDADSLVGLLNAYYDIGTYAGFTPYIGGGIGFADNHASRTRISVGATNGTLSGNSQTDFAWQASAGVSYSFTQNWAVDLGYRYMDMGQLQTGNRFTTGGLTTTLGGSATGDLQAHEIQVGLRYSF